MIALHQGKFTGNDAEALTVYALSLALRTGLNTAPLLELKRDAIQPHPFLPRMGILTSFKRRGTGTHIKTLRRSRADRQNGAVSMDGVALFYKVLDRTRPLAESAPPALRNAVWLYESTDPRTNRRLTKLRCGTLGRGIGRFIARHDLRADFGGHLRLNLRRLRVTMENRLWQLSNGDLFTVAQLMGHDPKVADQHYLAVTPEMRAHATIVGEALPDIYCGRDAARTEGADWPLIPIHRLENTPVGSCKDSLYGDKAPKDGINHCMDFLSCFGCRSYAIVGSKKDLHRLFSFYWFLDVERARIRSRKWSEHFVWVMQLIDAFTLDKFDNALVAEAKAWAKQDPLKFWKSYQLQAEGLTAHGD